MVTFEEAAAIVKRRLYVIKHPIDNNILIGDDGETWYDVTDKTPDYVETIIKTEYPGIDLDIEAGRIRL